MLPAETPTEAELADLVGADGGVVEDAVLVEDAPADDAELEDAELADEIADTRWPTRAEDTRRRPPG